MSDPYKRKNWEWYGTSGHFIGAKDCRFHMATIVGDYLVSTVGEYLPPSLASGDQWVEIGDGRTYETMVFPVARRKRCRATGCECGMPDVSDWGEVASDAYNDRGSAQRGHYAMCEKIAKSKGVAE